MAGTFRFVLFLLLAACTLGFGTTSATAQQPSASRTRLAIVTKNGQDFVTFSQISANNVSDRYYVLLFGSGVANLHVADAGELGDTVRAEGNLVTLFPTSFTESAASPQAVEVPLVIGFIGLLTVDVSYTGAVNPQPYDYLLRLSF